MKLERRAGIYAIVNRRNQHKYIGQAMCLPDRRASHFGNLVRGKHHCKYLQNAFNLYDANAFTFVVLEYVTCYAILNEREQYWIDELKPEYNSILDIESGVARYEKREMDTLTFLQEEKFERPVWHEWVYGGAKNPNI